MAGGGQGGGAPTQGYANGGNIQPPTIGATPQNQNFMQGPDVTGNYAGGMGFDNSGSDGGVGGQPAPMQSPFQRQFAWGGPTNAMPMSTGMNPAMGGSMGTMGGSQFNQPQAPFSPTQGGQNMNMQGGSQFNQPQAPFSPTQGGQNINMQMPAGFQKGMQPPPQQFNQPQAPFSPTQGGQVSIMGGSQFNQPQAPFSPTQNMNMQAPAGFQKGMQQPNMPMGTMGGALGPMPAPGGQMGTIPVGKPPVGGMMSTIPVQQGNKPLSMGQITPQKGLQVQGNPTSQVVQRPQQR